MAAPNIVNVTTIYGKTAVLAVSTSATAILTNSAASGKVLKVNTLYVGNNDSATNTNLNVDIYRSSTAYNFVKNTTVPAGGSLDILSNSIYLEEGDSLRLTASNASKLEAVCSYEEIS